MRRCKTLVTYEELERLLGLRYPIVHLVDRQDSGAVEVIMDGGMRMAPGHDVPFVPDEECRGQAQEDG